MPAVTPEKLAQLQATPEDVRNICIMAHVDHGKTSLTDSLIATNGIISSKMAGKVRYLDSRPDEQTRGITMESSAISLHFEMMRRTAPDAEPVHREYLINLIDSPGHIDFSSEVSTASRLCDGAVVLVDAVEGVCSQTVTVLRQTWIEKLKPLLVINKIDRLITELKMSPGEAYSHLSKLLEQVNAVIGSFFQGERMEEDLAWREKIEQRVAKAAEAKNAANAAAASSSASSEAADVPTDATMEFEEKDDEDLYFAPEKNNVIFGSAMDGWAFTIRQFAAIYERKLGIKRAILEKVLWGDFYLDPKTKRVLGQRHLKGRNLKPMFVQLVLESIWAVYDATVGGDDNRGDPAKLEKITKSLNIKIPTHLLRSRDTKTILSAVVSGWLPLSTALLVSVVEYLPDPVTSQASRLPEMIEDSPGGEYVDPKLKDAMVTFKASKDDPVVAYVSKMVAIPESELPTEKRNRSGNLSPEEARELARKKRAEIAKAQALAEAQADGGVSSMTNSFSQASIGGDEGEEEEKVDPEHLIGFARLYSGTLSVGDSVYVLQPKFSPENPHAKPEPEKVTITALYLLMGRSLEPLKTVPAGSIFGVEGLAGHVLKTGTLCSQLEGSVNLAGVNMASQPIVRVALEPVNPTELGKMITGLKLLEQSDPCAQYEFLESGEHCLLTAGELHLERCLKDLTERFAKCEIQAGEPIVPYRETIIAAQEMLPPKSKELPRGTVVTSTTSNKLDVKLRVRPLPTAVTEFLGKHANTIKKLAAEKRAKNERRELGQDEDQEIENQETALGDGADRQDRRTLSLEEFRKELQDAFGSATKEREVWKDVLDDIVAFGPKRFGPNILVDTTAAGNAEKLLRHEQSTDKSHGENGSSNVLTSADFISKIIHAFQLAMFQGPLCNEPVQGVCVTIESITVNNALPEEMGRLTSEVIRTVRDGIHNGFLDWSPRLLLAMYRCEIQADINVLGRVYGVLSRRQAHVIDETLSPTSPSLYLITAALPLNTSFGFVEDILKRTSGGASPQLVFTGFEILDQDPFWVPNTEEELEDLGELADRENRAKMLMEQVRVRKGLFVKGKKVVKDAEKQKNLKR